MKKSKSIKDIGRATIKIIIELMESSKIEIMIIKIILTYRIFFKTSKISVKLKL